MRIQGDIWREKKHNYLLKKGENIDLSQSKLIPMIYVKAFASRLMYNF
jgi:hypothetical protein